MSTTLANHFHKTMNKEELTIFLLPPEAQKFVEFQQHYDLFNLLMSHGVFNVRNGSVALHFDANGTITTIQRADLLYNVRTKGSLSTP